MHSRRLLFVCSLALSLVIPRILNAGVNDWTNISPPAGDVEQIVFDPVNPQIVYGILSGQLYASLDGAEKWHPVESLSLPQRIRTIAIDPHQSGTIYAAPFEHGIVKSTDFGGTWQFMGLATEPVGFVAVHPVKSWMLYAVAGQDIYRSTDRGGSWKAVSRHGEAFMLAFSPANPSVIYAGGFLRSTDEGASWHRIGSGYPYVAVHPQRPDTLVGWVEREVGWSTDGGYSWKSNFQPVVPFINVLVFSPNDPNTLYIGTDYYDGLYRSTDLGATWAPSNAGLSNYYVTSLAWQPGSQSKILAGTGGSGFFMSTDSGASWTASGQGLRQASVTSLAVGGKSGTIYVGTRTAGFFRSRDSGKTWQQINEGLPMTRVREIAIDPANPNLLFALLDDDLFRTTNGGDRWEPQGELFDPGLVVSLPVADPRTPGRWYLTAYYLPGEGPNDAYLLMTNNGGQNWERISNPLPAGAQPLAMSPHDGRLYLLSFEGLYVSYPPLFDWQLSSPLVFLNLVFDPDKQAIILGVTETGEPWRSTDRGGSWSPIELEGRVSALAYARTSTPGLFALGEGGLHYSTDAGSTWQLITRRSVLSSLNTFGGSIQVDPLHPDLVYAVIPSLGGFFVLEHAASLFVPRLALVPGKESTGLALSNRGDREAALTITAFDQSGDLVQGSAIDNPVHVILKPGEQKAMLAPDWFGAGLVSRKVDGWIRIDGAFSTVTGFSSAFSADLAILDTAAASHLTSKNWLFPEVDTKRTELRVANPGAEGTDVILELRNAQGELKQRTGRSIPPGGVLAETTEMLFGSQSSGDDSIWIQSDQPVIGLEYETDGKSYAKVLLSLEPDEDATVLVAPQYAAGPDVQTAVTVVNLDPVPGTVLVQVYGDDGVPRGRERQVTIGGRGKVRIDDPGFFDIDSAQPFTGYARIVSPSVRITGSVSFEDPSQHRFSAALPLVTQGGRELVFSHLVSTPEFFTGLAVLNRGLETAVLTIRVYRPDGGLLAEKQVQLQPGMRRSSLLVEYFPELAGTPLSGGTIQITSSEELAALALFGRYDLDFLSTITAQVLR